MSQAFGTVRPGNAVNRTSPTRGALRILVEAGSVRRSRHRDIDADLARCIHSTCRDDARTGALAPFAATASKGPKALTPLFIARLIGVPESVTVHSRNLAAGEAAEALSVLKLTVRGADTLSPTVPCPVQVTVSERKAPCLLAFAPPIPPTRRRRDESYWLHRYLSAGRKSAHRWLHRQPGGNRRTQDLTWPRRGAVQKAGCAWPSSPSSPHRLEIAQEQPPSLLAPPRSRPRSASLYDLNITQTVSADVDLRLCAPDDMLRCRYARLSLVALPLE